MPRTCKLSALEIAEIKKLHASDRTTWNSVTLAPRFQVSERTILRAIKGYRERDRTARARDADVKEASALKRRAGLTEHRDRCARDVFAMRRRVLKSMDADTRTLGQILCGEPPPGRSALDQRRKKELL